MATFAFSVENITLRKTSMQDLKSSTSTAFSRIEDERSKLLAQLYQEYCTADGLAKEVEEFRDEAGVPAFNELRYAGYHLLTAIASEESLPGVDGDVDAVDQLRSAITHARRASYEAVEAGVEAALALIEEFHQAYKSVVISEVIEEWVSIQKDCDRILRTVSKKRKAGLVREEDHESYLEQFRTLRDHYNTTKYAEDELNKKIRKQNREIMFATAGIVVAAAAAIVGVIALISG